MARTFKGWGKRRNTRVKSGYRSKSEERFAAHLETLGVPFDYEKKRIRYRPKETFYLVDFELPGGMMIEYKGHFESADRTKHLLLKEQHPELDIRFVFDHASNKLSKTSTTTYGNWCDKHGFKWAEKIIPPEWIKEMKLDGKRTPPVPAVTKTTQLPRKGRRSNSALGHDRPWDRQPDQARLRDTKTGLQRGRQVQA